MTKDSILSKTFLRRKQEAFKVAEKVTRSSEFLTSQRKCRLRNDRLWLHERALRAARINRARVRTHAGLDNAPAVTRRLRR